MAKSLRIRAKLTKKNKAMEKVLNKSILHQEGHHKTHTAYKTGHSSAGSHRAAHHTQRSKKL